MQKHSTYMSFWRVILSEAVSRMMVARGRAEGSRTQRGGFGQRYKLSVMQDENVLEICYTT